MAPSKQDPDFEPLSRPGEWHPAYVGRWNHHKFRAIQRLLKLDKRLALGTLDLLWDYGVLNGKTEFGILPNVPYLADDLASYCDWPGDPDEFLTALIEVGWIDRREDGQLALHDWDHYYGKRIARRERDAERKRGSKLKGDDTGSIPLDIPRNSIGHPSDLQRISNGTPADIPRTSSVEESRAEQEKEKDTDSESENEADVSESRAAQAHAHAQAASLSNDENLDSDSKNDRKTPVDEMIPHDWLPTRRTIDHGKRLGLNDYQIAETMTRFRDTKKAHGDKYRDWQAIARKWLDDQPAVELNYPTGEGSVASDMAKRLKLRQPNDWKPAADILQAARTHLQMNKLPSADADISELVTEFLTMSFAYGSDDELNRRFARFVSGEISRKEVRSEMAWVGLQTRN